MSAAVYVYYRLAADRAGAIARLRMLLEAIARLTGVHGRLMQQQHDPNLLMEVYEPVASTSEFLAELDRQVRALDIATQLLPGSTRKLEIFTELADLTGSQNKTGT